MIASRITLSAALWKLADAETLYEEESSRNGFPVVRMSLAWHHRLHVVFGRDDWTEFIAAKEEVNPYDGRFGVRIGTRQGHVFFARCLRKRWLKRERKYLGYFAIAAVWSGS